MTHHDIQYVAFYDANAHVVLSKRQVGTADWEIQTTHYTGNVRDAHNSISIMVDGAGFLHMSWDQHDSPLRYCRSKKPGSLELSDEMEMTGEKERNVTYPEFHRLPEGDLIFMYRDGSSGNGNIMMNRYNAETKTWSRLQDAFIDGEGQRNAYWQAAIDARGAIHISWVWRETWDVATNHDMCYAKSADGGITWHMSDGTPYDLPITAASAEYVCRIAQGSDLINQTSMSTDSRGCPYIATYWKPPGTDVPQYFLLYHNGNHWLTSQVANRKSEFSLSGGGTKKIPVSRPGLLIDDASGAIRAYLIFCDSERDNRVSVARCDDLEQLKWETVDLSVVSYNSWEPTYDTELWKRENLLHLLVQNVLQEDSEKLASLPAQPVSILEWETEN